jgi:nucleoside-diphosphate-sugar epimerase
MKLVIVGSSGFVGKELVRQAISTPAITSVVGLARRETPVPENLSNPADAAKLTSVVCDDFLNYSDHVKQQLSNADACIW